MFKIKITVEHILNEIELTNLHLVIEIEQWKFFVCKFYRYGNFQDSNVIYYDNKLWSEQINYSVMK